MAAAVMSLPGSPLVAQVCTVEMRSVTGTVVTGDKSYSANLSGPALVGVISIPHNPNGSAGGSGTLGPLPTSITVSNFPGAGSYVFRPGGNLHYSPADGGSATCWYDGSVPTPCLRCSGSFAFTFYSKSGALKGKVRYRPDGAPIPSKLVRADPPLGGVQVLTNASGDYQFKSPQFPLNNWYFTVPALAGGPGSALYQVQADAADIKPVTIQANVMSEVDLEVPRPNAEVPPRCNAGSQQSPGPGASSSTTSSPAAQTPACTVGCPVSVTTGNVDVDQTDAVVPGSGLGLRFTRSYNSANAAVPERYGVFGAGWNHSYEKRLTFPWTGSIKLRNSDGTITYFSGSDAAGYDQTAPYSQDSRIVKTPSTNLYVRLFKRGGQEVYDRLTPTGTSARLTTLADAVGNTTVLTYTSNQLTTIADPGGRQLALGYTGTQLTTLTGPSGLIATFVYASGRLSSVTYADGNGDALADGGFTYAYHASGNGAGKLWKVTDASGRVTETHLYDTSGRANETSISGNVRKYTLVYQAAKTVVTDSLGNQTEYQFQTIAGIQRIIRTIGSCSSCGGGGSATEEWSYDAKGRVTSRTDGEGTSRTTPTMPTETCQRRSAGARRGCAAHDRLHLRRQRPGGDADGSQRRGHELHIRRCRS